MANAPLKSQVLINMYADGTLEVQGNVPDRVMLLGLIECAKEAINEGFRKKTNQSSIIKVPPGAQIPPNSNHG